MAKTKSSPKSEQPAENAYYRIVGLQMADVMTVYYGGEKYNLARLTNKQADTLIESGYPHLVKV